MVRALLKRPVVLVFDQAAAVLDPTTQLVVENVLHERKGKTVVWVLSRPSSPTASISCW